MSYAFLYSFSDRLKEVVDRGGGNLALVPYPVAVWGIRTTLGGEIDIIAWPIVEYNTAKVMWSLLANKWASLKADRVVPDWPLGKGDAVRETLDKYNPTEFSSEKIATAFLKNKVLVYVQTVAQARNSIEYGLRVMDPDYPWTRRITPMWIAGGIAAIVLGGLAFKL